jgi:hypothetical protein
MSPGRLDLATEWRRRRWRRLLNIIDNLPRESRFFEARVNDEHVVEALVKAEGKEAPAGPAGPTRRMADWSAEVELLTAAVNRLGEIAQGVATLGGAKPGKVPPAPQPTTAYETVRNRLRSRKHESLVSRLLPHKKA